MVAGDSKHQTEDILFLEPAIGYVGILMILKNRGTDLGRPVAVTICNNLKKIEILDWKMVVAVGKRSPH